MLACRGREPRSGVQSLQTRVVRRMQRLLAQQEDLRGASARGGRAGGRGGAQGIPQGDARELNCPTCSHGIEKASGCNRVQ